MFWYFQLGCHQSGLIVPLPLCVYVELLIACHNKVNLEVGLNSFVIILALQPSAELDWLSHVSVEHLFCVMFLS